MVVSYVTKNIRYLSKRLQRYGLLGYYVGRLNVRQKSRKNRDNRHVFISIVDVLLELGQKLRSFLRSPCILLEMSWTTTAILEAATFFVDPPLCTCRYPSVLLSPSLSTPFYGLYRLTKSTVAGALFALSFFLR